MNNYYVDKIYFKILIFVFSFLTLVEAIAGFYNSWQFILAGFCAAMLVISLIEFKSIK